MVWYRFWKKSGPTGALSEKYEWFESPRPDKEGVKLECEAWADRIPGGHNTHYTYGFQKVAHPPKKVLERMIANKKSSIKFHKGGLKFLQEELKRIN